MRPKCSCELTGSKNERKSQIPNHNPKIRIQMTVRPHQKISCKIFRLTNMDTVVQMIYNERNPVVIYRREGPLNKARQKLYFILYFRKSTLKTKRGSHSK